MTFVRWPVAGFWALALLSCLMTSACSWVPITDGFYGPVSPPSGHMAIVGNHPSAVGAATTWLKKYGRDAVDASQFNDPAIDRALLAAASPKRDAAIMRVANTLDIPEVVFVTYLGDIRAPMVLVRSVRTRTAEVQWAGSARYDAYAVRALPDAVSELTCMALSTAWGVLQSGKQWQTLVQRRCEAWPVADLTKTEMR